MTPGSNPAGDELAFADLTRLSDLLAGREVTSTELVSALLRRIEEIDRAGPRLGSVIALCPDAAETAALLDAEAARGRRRSPLHGVPVLVKDSIDTATTPTTAGSLALSEAAGVGPPGRDATAVARLRAAGAVVVAKANLSEWSNARGRPSVTGWSAVGGQTRNPHALDRSPGGSSSGSAAAVAAGIGAAALGGETDGSILCPAAFCGVVGLKPTVGLVPRTGVVPISSTQDSIGPITRSVADAALVLEAIAGPDAEDEASAGAPADRSYAAGLDGAALGQARLGVPRARFWGYSPRADAVVEEALGVVRSAGATLVDPTDIPTASLLRSSDNEEIVFRQELRVGLASYLARRFGAGDGPVPGAGPRDLGALIAFNEAHAEQELGLFGQEFFLEAMDRAGRDEVRYPEARATNLRRARGGIDAVLGAWKLDALVVPTLGPAPLVDPVNGLSIPGSSSFMSAIAGYPAVTVPAGETAGLPVGLCLFGTAWSEPTLLRLAYAIERALAVRLRPSFRPAIGL